MAPLDKLINRLVKYRDNIPKYVIDSIQKREKTVFRIVRNQVQKNGINGLGEKITNPYKTYPIYSAGYERYKRRIGKYTNKIDLTLSGDYLKSLEFVRMGVNKFYVDSDHHTDDNFDLATHLFDTYPYHLLLTKENQSVVSKLVVEPYLKKKFNETIRI